MLSPELVKVLPAGILQFETGQQMTLNKTWYLQTLVGDDATEAPPFPKFLIGIPSREEVMVVKIGLIRWTAASSGSE